MKDAGSVLLAKLDNALKLANGSSILPELESLPIVESIQKEVVGVSGAKQGEV